jgi:FkbH-like protein
MSVLAEYRQLRKESRLPEALDLARRSIPSLEANELSQLARLVINDLAKAKTLSAKPLDVLILGQCTTTYLLPLVTTCAWAEGVHCTLREGGYDQILQELLSIQEFEAPQIIILLPWHERLLGVGERVAAERMAYELSFLQQAWSQVARLQSKLIQVSYDALGPGPLGYSLSGSSGGDLTLIHGINHALRDALPPGAYLIDLESISAWQGRARFYDERNYHWLKQPFSTEGLCALGRHLATALRVLTTGRKKVLALDLDNTLWGGVVGETGPHGITLGSGSPEGEAFLAFQKHLKKLKNTGVLLAACSKNNEADAKAPFEQNSEMVLGLGDFASFHASWDSKPTRLRRIAEELNLGLDSIVFFDDNPAEREHVRAELPQVMVIEAPHDPSQFIRALQESLAFETAALTVADSGRTAQYQAEASRREAQTSAESPQAYLASLQMRAEVQDIGPANLDRVVDLITKTNQFNLTTRRHSRAAVEAMVATPGSVCFAVKLADKFGDYGLIAVVLALPQDAKTLRVDTWLMSCRAMGRTGEHFTLNHLATEAKKKHYSHLLAEYLPTPKNTPVESLLLSLGFSRNNSEVVGVYEYILTSHVDTDTQVSA